MTSRPRPYQTGPILPRWSGVVSVAGLVLLLVAGRDPTPPWGRLLGALLGLLFVAQAVDGLRTSEVHLRFSLALNFEATRWERPIRFWLLTAMNLSFGLWIVVHSIFLVTGA
jgi:hypothetical protein